MPDTGEKLSKIAGRSLLRQAIIGALTGGVGNVFLLIADASDLLDVLDVTDALDAVDASDAMDANDAADTQDAVSSTDVNHSSMVDASQQHQVTAAILLRNTFC